MKLTGQIILDEKIMKQLKELERVSKLHCPCCNSVMDSETYNMQIDRKVYKCRGCGKWFV